MQLAHDMIRRRSLLRSFLGAGLVGVSGCESGGKTPERGETETATDVPTQAPWLPDRSKITGWPMFRQNPAHTGHSPGGDGLADPADLAVEWRTVLDGRSGPKRLSFAGGVLAAAGRSRDIWLVDATSGEQAVVDYGDQGDLSGPVDTEVTFDDGRAYATTGEGGGAVLALEPFTGDRLWSVRVPVVEHGPHGTKRYHAVESSPAATSGCTVYGVPHFEEADQTAGNRGAVGCRSPADGNAAWDGLVHTTARIRSSPTVDGDRVYVKAGGTVVAIERESGSVIWRTSVGAGSYQPLADEAPATDGELVFAVGEDRVISALEADSGEERWTFEASGPTDENIKPLYNVAVAGDVVVFGTSDGSVTALTPDDGSIRWQWTDEDVVYWTMPATDGRTVFIAGNEGKHRDESLVGMDSEAARFVALDVENGERKFGTSGTGVSMPPVVANEAVYVPLGATVVKYA